MNVPSFLKSYSNSQKHFFKLFRGLLILTLYLMTQVCNCNEVLKWFTVKCKGLFSFYDLMAYGMLVCTVFSSWGVMYSDRQKGRESTVAQYGGVYRSTCKAIVFPISLSLSLSPSGWLSYFK